MEKIASIADHVIKRVIKNLITFLGIYFNILVFEDENDRNK